MLPDKELDRLAAERIMKWPLVLADDEDRKHKVHPCLYETDGGWLLYRESNRGCRYWSPANDLKDAVEIMAKTGEFWKIVDMMIRSRKEFVPRAITIAALRAVGALEAE